MSSDDENRWIGEFLASAAFQPRAAEQARQILADIAAGRTVSSQSGRCACAAKKRRPVNGRPRRQLGQFSPTGGRTGSGKFGAVIAAADTTDATCKVRLSGVPTAAA